MRAMIDIVKTTAIGVITSISISINFIGVLLLLDLALNKRERSVVTQHEGICQNIKSM